MQSKMPTAILLCAGRGTRMNDDRTHKVCYEIAGKPTIIRLIDNLKSAGIGRFIVVVGSKANKVMECLDGVDGVVYAYQKEQSGTGNAALIGLRALLTIGHDDAPALICMGDKIITPDVFSALIKGYSKNSGVIFAIQPKKFNASGGRIVQKGNTVYGIVEQMDSFLQKISESLPLSSYDLKSLVASFGLNEKKEQKLLSAAAGLTSPLPRVFRNVSFSSDEIEKGAYVNTATYLMDPRLAVQALSALRSDNAQNEIYLTDAVNRIAETHDVKTVVVDDPQKLLTYSTMEELLKLSAYFSPHPKTPVFPKASDILSLLKVWSSDTQEKFIKIYGENPKLIEERRQAYIGLLNAFLKKYGDQAIVIARAPGRINLMGRHIEHRGGSINVMTIDREMLVAAAVRDDDTIHMANTDPAFTESSFSILEHIKKYNTENWLEFIESDAITEIVNDHKGDWRNYVKAAVLRLQLGDRSRVLHGMNMMFSGNIPIAAGLSSSSSIVVATLEAALALNQSKLKVGDFISMCGEGEWLVGSRGGAGDHAAMKCGVPGKLTHLFFNPFSVGESVDFPKDYRLIIANSFVEAKKSAGAKDRFNSKIASYEFGFLLLKKNYPQFAHKMRTFKDINPKTLSIPPSKIYEMLLTLPEQMTPEKIRFALPNESKTLDSIFKTHSALEKYDIRGVILYGIAECERSEYCIDCLKRHDYRKLGQLMNISHNGDRIYQDGKPYDHSVNDSDLYGLIRALKSEDPQQVEKAQLYNQPGSYCCSTKEIDALIDFINQQSGVIGSQLSGAGLGGCVMILVKAENAQDLLSQLKTNYYDPIGKPMGAAIYSSVMGSNVLDL